MVLIFFLRHVKVLTGTVPVDSLKEEICLKVKTNEKKMEIRLIFRVPSLLSLLRNKKLPQPSGKPAPIARFALQELHFQILHQRRWERRS